jgi:hypothetical protein
LVGHSIGGSVVSYLGSEKDKRHTLDSGYTIGQPTRDNGNHYRTRFDVVSSLAAGGKHMKTLNNDHVGINKLIRGHDVDNIKNKNIYV